MTKALIVIDFINDIVHPDGQLNSCAHYVSEHGVIDKANEVIRLFRKHKWPLYFIALAFKDDYSDLPKDWATAKDKQMLKQGTWNTQMIDSLDFYPEADPLIIKNRVSPFYKTALEGSLQAQGVDEIYLIGVATNNAIALGAREAWDRDLSPTIITDACGAATQEIHQKTLDILPPVIKKLTLHEVRICLQKMN